MTNQETKNAQSQSQDSGTAAGLPEQDSASIPTTKYGKSKTNSNRDNTQPSERRFLWLSILFDALLFLVTSVYAFFAYHQWQVMNRQAEIFKTQAEVMSKQLESMNSSSMQAERLIQANESLVEQSRTLVEHAGEQARASLAQAEAAKRTVGAAQDSARAAKKGAQVAEESMILSARPYVASFSRLLRNLASGQSVLLELRLANDGNSPAEVTLEGDIHAARYAPNEGHFITPFTLQTVVLPGREKFFRLETDRTLYDDELTEINNGKSWLHFSAKGWYAGIGGRYPISFCYAFDFHVVIAQPTNHKRTMIIEFPNPVCSGVCKSDFLDEMREARDAFIAQFGMPVKKFTELEDPVLVEIVGIGFFDRMHGQRGRALPSGIELHPIIAFKVIE